MLRASMACYRDIFTLLSNNLAIVDYLEAMFGSDRLGIVYKR
jgi:hypothetical protein